MKLLYSPKGSPFVEIGDGFRAIFSVLTAGDDGIKYLIFSNTPLEKTDEISHRINFITNMRMKTNGDDKSMSLPKEFRRTNIYQRGYVAALKLMLEKYLTSNSKFPFSAFPKLAEDIEAFNKNGKKILKKIKNSEAFEDGRKNNRIGGKKNRKNKEKRINKEKKEKKVKRVIIKKEKKTGKPEKTKKATKVKKNKKILIVTKKVKKTKSKGGNIIK